MSPVAAERASAASALGEEAAADPAADPEPAADDEPPGWAPEGACTAGAVDELEEPHPTAAREVATRMEQRTGSGSLMSAHAAPDDLNIS